MQKWEYLLIATRLNRDDVRAVVVVAVDGERLPKEKRQKIIPYLKKLGNDGWEMVHRKDGEYIFKRPKE